MTDRPTDYPQEMASGAEPESRFGRPAFLENPVTVKFRLGISDLVELDRLAGDKGLNRSELLRQIVQSVLDLH